jgi:hypothetical protein
MLSFLFGKRTTKRTTKRSVKRNVKPSASLRKMAKKCNVKITIKRGSKRVYKKISVIKKQIKQKMKKKKIKRVIRRVRSSKRQFRFGSHGSPIEKSDTYGYFKSTTPYPGTLSQTSQVVNSKNNSTRLTKQLGGAKDLPINGTYSRFFTSEVPRTIGPDWNCMGQTDGSCTMVGSPFYRYTD